MMSANITAASTPWRRTGCSVTSAQSSGVCATSQKECCSRIARYSGSERPAWRMNQTGVRSTGSRRAARTRSGSTAVRLASRVEGTSRRPLGRAAPSGAAGGHDRDRERRGDERRLAAVGRPGLPRLPLARRPRQPDRLGRAAQRGAAARAGRERVGRGDDPRADPARPLPARVRHGRRAARLVLGARQPDARRRRRGRPTRRRAERDAARARRAGAGLGRARPRRARRGLRRRRRRDRVAGVAAAPAAARAGAVRAGPRPRARLLVAAPLPVGAARDRAGAARRGRGAAGVRRAAGRAVGLRRADRAARPSS